MKGEDTSLDDFLGGKLCLKQPIKGFRAGSDAVFLAASVKVDSDKSCRILDVGAGVGTVGLCLATVYPQADIYAVELQQEYADYATWNADYNGVKDRYHIVRGNVCDLHALFEPDSFDYVVTNPPYFESAKNRPAETVEKQIAHQGDEDMTLEIWVRKCLAVLKNKGFFYVIFRTDRLPDLLNAIGKRAGDIQIFPLWDKKTKSKRVLIRCIKSSRSPVTLLKGLQIHLEDGTYTKQADAILKGHERIEWISKLS